MAAEAFTWGSGGNKLTAADRRRRMAEALMQKGTDYSPVGHWAQGAARVAQALMGGLMMRDADANDRAREAEDAKIGSALVSQLLGGATPPAATSATASPIATAPSMAGGSTARTMAMPAVAPEIKDGIVQTASALGIDPVDLATTISYETAGTFDPTKRGPTTQWGQHRGLIQFGEPQAKQHGVDWANPVASQLGPNGAVASYLKTAGVKPGMGLLDIYSAINAGAPGLYNRSDANNGGAPGTVRDKVEKQMAAHRAKAQALFADLPSPNASPVSAETGQPGFFIPPGEQPAPAMSGRTFGQIANALGTQPLDPVFQAEGVSQPWMGTALPPQPMAPAAPAMVAAPMPPPRPTDLAMPQADLPSAGAQPAMLQVPTAPVEDLSNAPGAGAREGIVQALMAQQGQTAPAGFTVPPAPVSGAPAAVPAEAGAAPGAAATPAVAQVAQAMSQQPTEILSQALMSENPAIQRVAAAVLQQRIEAQKPKAQWLEEKLPDGSLAQRNSQTGEIKVVRPSEILSAEQEAQKIRLAQAGRTQVNVNGGGSDKQVFDAVKESADAARAAATGLVSLREARRAVEGGAILGAGADLKLGLQKAAAAFGIGDTSKIVNTETFRSAIAPQISAMMKATVGSTQISNADREFAEKAAGGSISLDEGSIRRLLDIMERGNIAILEGHQKRMDAIYPDETVNKRERALFGVQVPAAPASPVAGAPDRAALEAEARRRGLIK